MVKTVESLDLIDGKVGNGCVDWSAQELRQFVTMYQEIRYCDEDTY